MADMLVENSRETLFWLQQLGLRFLPLYDWQFKLPDGRIRFSGGSALEVMAPAKARRKPCSVPPSAAAHACPTKPRRFR